MRGSTKPGDSTPTGPAPGDTPSRSRILHLLKTRGSSTAARLAERMDLTTMAVRQHLARLEEEGLVAFEELRQAVGRPARSWHLTAAAAKRFPDAHGELAVDLIETVRDALGPAALERLVEERGRRQLAAYRSELPGTDASLSKRVRALARLREREGYMAEVQSRTGGAFLLVENHCPICAAAEICQGLCRSELDVFREVLGNDATVERTEHQLDGQRRCAYLVTPRQG